MECFDVIISNANPHKPEALTKYVTFMCYYIHAPRRMEVTGQMGQIGTDIVPVGQIVTQTTLCHVQTLSVMSHFEKTKLNF
jgi:hypothetical protein